MLKQKTWLTDTELGKNIYGKTIVWLLHDWEVKYLSKNPMQNTISKSQIGIKNIKH